MSVMYGGRACAGAFFGPVFAGCAPTSSASARTPVAEIIENLKGLGVAEETIDKAVAGMGR